VLFRSQGGTKIDTLPGGQFQGDIDDVQYLRDKLFSAIKVPQAYLSSAKDKAPEDKSTLAQKDIRFARTVQRLQRIITSELEKIGIIHLYTLGYRNEDLLKFKIKLNNPSKISELQEIEHFKAQLEVAAAAKENGFSKRWIYENVFRMNDTDFLRIQRDLYYDKQTEKAIEAGEVSDTGTVGGGTTTADTAALGLEGGEGGEASAGETPAEETPAPEEESNLLAAPARRDDSSYTTPGAKGKVYTPVKYDSRPSGARSRHFERTHTPESTTSKYRNLFAGSKPLSQASKGIFNESSEGFESDEKMLMDVENKLQMLSKTLLKEDKESEKE
jgi:hypothetical protein